MRDRGWASVGLWTVLAVAAGCGGGQDQGKGYLIRHAGVTLAQAASLAEAQVPGRAVKVELVYRGKQVVYQVEILDAVNQPRQVLVDAETGKIVR
jgi:uncharacterized membrane protein YkoI